MAKSDNQRMVMSSLDAFQALRLSLAYLRSVSVIFDGPTAPLEKNHTGTQGSGAQRSIRARHDSDAAVLFEGFSLYARVSPLCSSMLLLAAYRNQSGATA